MADKVRRHLMDILCKIIHESQADGAAGDLEPHSIALGSISHFNP